MWSIELHGPGMHEMGLVYETKLGPNKLDLDFVHVALPVLLIPSGLIPWICVLGSRGQLGAFAQFMRRVLRLMMI